MSRRKRTEAPVTAEPAATGVQGVTELPPEGAGMDRQPPLSPPGQTAESFPAKHMPPDEVRGNTA